LVLREVSGEKEDSIMGDWTIWATFLALGNALALLAIYLICRARIEKTRNRVSVLEREMALAQVREQANEKQLAKIFEAVMNLREATEDQLAHLRTSLDELIHQGAPQKKRSAA